MTLDPHHHYAADQARDGPQRDDVPAERLDKGLFRLAESEGVANIIAQGTMSLELASGFHTNFRMEKFDALQELRLLRRDLHHSPSSPKPVLLFRTCLPT